VVGLVGRLPEFFLPASRRPHVLARVLRVVVIAEFGGVQGVTERGSMKVTVRTEVDAVKLAQRKLLKPAWYPGRITEALEKVAQRSGKDTIELSVTVEDRSLRTWLSDAERGAALMRHCCQACGDEVFQRYEAGEVGQDDFPGHDVEVKIGIQKGNRAFPGDRNIIEDFRAPADSRVVNLRAG
jgi:hypothetical protein